MKNFVDVNVNAEAAQAINVNKNEVVNDVKHNGYDIGVKAELVNPEITGSDTLEIKLEAPFGIKLEIKATSNVTSSVLAQETLNEQARKNLEQLGEFLTSAAMTVVPTINSVSEAIREQEKLSDEYARECRRKDQELEIELAEERLDWEHRREISILQHDNQIRSMKDYD